MVRVGAGVLAVLLVVGIAAGIGLGIHGATYNGQVDEYSAGSPDTEDRVSVMAVIEKVDSAQYVMNVRVWAVAHGRFTSDGGETANRDIRVRWALALAVAAAAAVVVRNRLGLVWPALAWMAATLFALAAFRGTAPGNPPIGTVLDLTAFLWAEAVVACALVGVVIRGVSLEWAKPVQPA